MFWSPLRQKERTIVMAKKKVKKSDKKEKKGKKKKKGKKGKKK